MTSIDIDRAARRMREAQSRIGSVMEDPYTWSNENENCTSSVREAAKLLDLEPGKLNGYMEVWLAVCAVQKAAQHLDRLQRLAEKGYTTR